MGTPPVRVTMARVQRPALVRPQRHRHWCAAATCPFASTTASHRQAFFPVNPVEPSALQTIPRIVCLTGYDFVHDHALALEQDADAPIAEATALLDDLVHRLTDFRPRHWA